MIYPKSVERVFTISVRGPLCSKSHGCKAQARCRKRGYGEDLLGNRSTPKPAACQRRRRFCRASL